MMEIMKQNKESVSRGVEWSGGEWSGVEWSGVGGGGMKRERTKERKNGKEEMCI